MEKMIQSIAELTNKLEDCTHFIEIWNQEIEQGTLIPHNLQQAQIDAIAEIGRNTINQINHLNELLGKI